MMQKVGDLANTLSAFHLTWCVKFWPLLYRVWDVFDLNHKCDLNFEYNDRRNKIIPKEVQAKHPRASSVTNT